MPEYIFVSTPEEYAAAGILFQEYANELSIDLCFQQFDEELLSLPKMYAPPMGCIVLCKENDSFVGSIAVRPKTDGVAELKRMYIQAPFRRKGIGKILLSKALDFAKQAGHHTVRLDTLNTMEPAMQLYQQNGFYTISAYYHNPEPTAVYFEKKL